MGRATDIERAAIDGGTQSSLGRLLAALLVVWLPTVFVMTLMTVCGQSVMEEPQTLEVQAGGGNVEPMGGLKAVLFVPISAVMEFGALWWAGAVWMQERRKRMSHGRRRRRRPLEKFLQRTMFVLVAVSLFANLPFFVWFLKRFYLVSVRF